MKLAILALSSLVFGFGASGLEAAHKDAGESVAERCAVCHGAEGISADPGVPHIAGQHAAYMVSAMKAYRDGSRDDERMKEAVAGLSRKDMASVAAYFESRRTFTRALSEAAGKAPAPTSVSVGSSDLAADIEELVAPCAACHGDTGNSEVPGTPGLAGQPIPYLEIATKAYRDGLRREEVMHAFASELSDPDIELIASFYAPLPATRGAGEIAGNMAAGAAASTSCSGCHGIDGNADDAKTPRLAGLDPEYFEAAIRAYKDGARADDTMQAVVKPLSDAAIVDMAAFYARQKPKAPPTPVQLSAEQWSQKCNRCHGPDGHSTDPRFPILAGQWESYLLKALRVYHVGRRDNSIMKAMSFPLREPDFRILAAYYASRRAP